MPNGPGVPYSAAVASLRGLAALRVFLQLFGENHGFPIGLSVPTFTQVHGTVHLLDLVPIWVVAYKYQSSYQYSKESLGVSLVFECVSLTFVPKIPVPKMALIMDA